jgi:uncharacterized protein (TIGR02284 family)
MPVAVGDFPRRTARCVVDTSEESKETAMAIAKFELTDELIKKIKNLIQLDIDASFAYQQAIDGVDAEDVDVKSALLSFKHDHERHIQELSAILTAQGHKPPDYHRDFKGFLIEGMTAIRSALGTRQALKAMRQNEILTNKRYQDAVELTGLPAEVHDIVLRGREDERRHLEAIEAMLGRYGEVGVPVRV